METIFSGQHPIKNDSCFMQQNDLIVNPFIQLLKYKFENYENQTCRRHRFCGYDVVSLQAQPRVMNQ